MEKEERKLYREVDKENDIRDRKKQEKEKKKKTFISSDLFNFKHNDNAVRKIMKVKNRTSIGLTKMSAQLSDVSRTDQSQARMDAMGRRD